MNRHLASAFAAFLALAGFAIPAAAEEIVLISTHTRDFIGTEAGGNSILKGVPLESQALVVDRIALDGDEVAFRTAGGAFVRAGVGQETLLAIGDDHIRGWQTFEIVRVTAAKFAIRSVQNGLYVSLGADGRLSATAADIGSRETFSSRPAPEQAAEVLPFPLPELVVPQGIDLAGEWRIHRVRTFDGSLTPIPQMLRGDTFIRVRDNGRLAASIGCNDIGARVREEAGLVQFGDVTTTRKLCIGEAGVYEALLLIALDHSRQVDDEGGQLRFFDVNGDPVMVLRRN
jgi:hypothetical protein